MSSAAVVVVGIPSSQQEPVVEEHDSENVAYDAFRLVFIPWQRRRRLAREQERMHIKRRSKTLSVGLYQPFYALIDGDVVYWGGIGEYNLPDEMHGCIFEMRDNFISVSAGVRHCIALQSDGNVMCWGDNEHGQAPPDGMAGDFVAIGAGGSHSLALRRDGSVACWGNNNGDQAPPAGVAGDFVDIAAGTGHSIAIRRNGSIACWGHNGYGQAPPDGIEGDFVAIDAGSQHSLALRRNGSIACWGNNDEGQAPPDGVDGDFVAIAAGTYHSAAIKRDGSLACWGTDVNICTGENRPLHAPPEGIAGNGGSFVAIAAGGNRALAIRQDRDGNDDAIVCWSGTEFIEVEMNEESEEEE